MVHPYNEILLNDKRIIDTHKNMDESLGIMLSKRSQCHKITYCMTPFI